MGFDAVTGELIVSKLLILFHNAWNIFFLCENRFQRRIAMSQNIRLDVFGDFKEDGLCLDYHRRNYRVARELSKLFCSSWQKCLIVDSLQLNSVQFSHSVMSNSLRPHGLQHTRPSCPSPTPGVYSNSCPLSLWCHLTISSSVIPFSFHLQSFPASGSFLMSQLFTSGDQRIGVSASASVLPMNIQDWSPLGWTG